MIPKVGALESMASNNARDEKVVARLVIAAVGCEQQELESVSRPWHLCRASWGTRNATNTHTHTHAKSTKAVEDACPT
jgi:hypothetical protein